MSRIYISKETVEKLYETTRLDKESKSLIDKFDPHRKEQPDKTSKKSTLVKTKTKAKNNNSHLSVEQKTVITKYNLKNTPSQKDAEKLFSGEIGFKTKNNELKEVFIHIKRARLRAHPVITPSPVSFMFAGVPRKTSSIHKQNAKSKPLYSSKGQDSYNLAGEYSARNVEFGHGRLKSQEWNVEVAKSLQSDLARLKKLRQDDPNTFDRGAMK